MSNTVSQMLLDLFGKAAHIGIKAGTGHSYSENMTRGQEHPVYGKLKSLEDPEAMVYGQPGHAYAAEQAARRLSPPIPGGRLAGAAGAMTGGLGIEALEALMGTRGSGPTKDTLQDTLANAAGAVRPISEGVSDWLIKVMSESPDFLKRALGESVK